MIQIRCQCSLEAQMFIDTGFIHYFLEIKDLKISRLDLVEVIKAVKFPFKKKTVL
jgi:hypothetical protein